MNSNLFKHLLGLCSQFKLENARLKNRPSRGSLKVADVEVLEVPAQTSFSHNNVLWWGDKRDAAADKEAKSLYNRVSRARLPDKTIVPAFPGSAGCRVEWDAMKQGFVDEYNDGRLPEAYLAIGKWPDEVDALLVWPGLARVAKQLPKILRTPRSAAPLQPRPSAADSHLPSLSHHGSCAQWTTRWSRPGWTLSPSWISSRIRPRPPRSPPRRCPSRPRSSSTSG